MTIPYRYVPGSVVDKVLKALDAAAVPMTIAQLREAVEYTGSLGAFLGILARPTNLGVFHRAGRLYTRGQTPTIIRERRVNYVAPAPHGWRKDIQMPAAMVGTLRTLMDDGTAVSTGDPLRALANAMDVARAVLTAGRKSGRFAGAEVDLLVARELRSITIAAQLAVSTLNEALEVLQ
jgi:hypothetical protein